MVENVNNRLRLAADMEIALVDHGSDDGHPQYKLNLDGNTLTVHSGAAVYFPEIDGAGSFIKNGTGEVQLQGAATYTGSFTVNNGVLNFRCGDYSAATMSVVSGSTAKFQSNCAADPSTISINGDGYTGRGAIECTTTRTIAAAVTVATDSRMKCLGGTVTFTGNIIGPGDLTLQGAGTLDHSGTNFFAISGANANNINSEEGTFNIGGATLDVANETGASELEYVIIDYSGGGTVNGQFTATNDLDAGWEVDYDGTATHTDSVVLVKTASPPETVIKFQ